MVVLHVTSAGNRRTNDKIYGHLLFWKLESFLINEIWITEAMVNKLILAGCTVVCADGSQEYYNCCVMAIHCPDALRILGNQATFDETRILGAFRYIYR